MRRLNRIAVLSAVLALVPASGALGQSDNFDDNTLGSAWTRVVDNPAQLNIFEQNARIEFAANNPTNPNHDAIYLSTGPAGFALSTASSFEIALDYNITRFGTFGGTGSSLLLVFGVGRDVDGTDSAAVAFGPTDLGFAISTALGVAHRTDDAQSAVLLNAGGPSAGTFVISYHAAGDDLTLGVGGFTFTLADTVQAVWGADQLLVSLGMRGSGFNISPGEAYLDNFTIRSGTVIPVPEPAVASVALAALLLRRRR